MRDFLHRLRRGRSLRELLLLGLGTYFAVAELGRDTDWPNFAVYLGATLAFAFRLFPARSIGVGTALSAIAQRWSVLLIHGTRISDLDWTAYAPFAALALLCSSDLVAKFDDAPTGIRWLPNLWGGLPRRDARLLRGCAYALAIVAALLFKSLQNRGAWGQAALWEPQVAVCAIYLAIALLAAGRASVLLAIPLLCAWVIVAVSGCVPFCVTMIANGDSDPSRPEYAVPVVVFALAGGLLALPFSVRLLRATLRARPND